MVLWACAVLPWSALAQLLGLALTLRLRAGRWPPPWVPDVDTVALPGQQALWGGTLMLAVPALLATPIVAICRRLAGRPSRWPLVVLNAAGFAALVWLARQPISSWAWD